MNPPDPDCLICGGTGETEVYGDPDNLAPCACTIPDNTDDEDMGDDGGGHKPIRPIAPPPSSTDNGGQEMRSPIQQKDLAAALAH